VGIGINITSDPDGNPQILRDNFTLWIDQCSESFYKDDKMEEYGSEENFSFNQSLKCYDV
jgi:hypothetical protein